MKKSARIARYFGWASLSCSVAAFTLWPYIHGVMFYSRAESLGVMFLAIGALLMQPLRLIWQLTVIATINRCLDEFFFDPFTLGWNEWIMFLMLAAGITVHNSLNKWLEE